MTVKIEYVGRNQPGSPVHQFTTDEGFVVGDSEKGYVNVLPEHVWFAVDEFAAMSEEERLPMLQSVVSAVEAAHEGGTPGTVILVFVFLIVFILYYFTNWKILSMIWQIG